MSGNRTAAERLVAISRWVDSHNAHRDPETNLWSRVTKASEEAGEAQTALRGVLGENPRKGVTHDYGDVIKELLDTAVAALGAVEHMMGHRGDSLAMLRMHINDVYVRSLGVRPEAGNDAIRSALGGVTATLTDLAAQAEHLRGDAGSAP